MPIPAIHEILEDPSASNWVKAALLLALPRDPVDAANDAEVLAEVLRAACDENLGKLRRV